VSTAGGVTRSAAARYALPALGAMLVASPVFFLILLLIFLTVMAQDDADQQTPCAATGGSVSVSVSGVPTGSVAGYSGAQLVGAAAIIQAGADAGFSVQGQTIGVMVSMGESTLTAVDHGDLAGPDSLGWFQQRDPWGPREVRLDAYGSATMFFTGGRGGQPGLRSVQGWETMAPTMAAHRVQRNADPNHYTRYWGPATQVVNALAGAQVITTPVVDGAGALPCGANPPLPPAGGASSQGWTLPAVGRMTSPYGPRWGTMHNGIDIAPGLGQPIYAAGPGVVIRSGPSTGYGNLIVVDHGRDEQGRQVLTRSAHMYPQDLMVRVGDPVVAGQQIARIGSYGDSTGPHLHFEVQLDGQFTDPVPWLRAHGVPLT